MGKVIFAVIKKVIGGAFIASMMLVISTSLWAAERDVNLDRELHMKEAVLVFELENYDGVFHQIADYEVHFDNKHQMHLLEYDDAQNIVASWNEKDHVLYYEDFRKKNSAAYYKWSLVSTTKADGVQIIAQYPEN